MHELSVAASAAERAEGRPTERKELVLKWFFEACPGRAQGGLLIENTHSTDVESIHRVRASVHMYTRWP
jgi:hypothetical protein